MIVEHLSLVDFRNYAAADVSLAAGPNVFVGRNGQGKTNLAEAIGYFATLGSHRVSQDAPMVRYGADAAFVRARLGYGDRRIQLEAQLNRSGSNKARVNGARGRPGAPPRSALGVLCAPSPLHLGGGARPARRRFADQLLVQRAPRMSGVLGDYDRVLKQRTALLKSARARGLKAEQLTTLDVWDDKLISLGTEIILARLRLAEDLAQPMRDAYEAIAGADHDPQLEWVLTVEGSDPEDDAAPVAKTGSAVGVDAVAASFRAGLAAKRSQELERGVTLVGPHRDDLLLRLRGLPVKGYASHGESWSTALSLRLSSAQLLRDQLRLGDPIVILDDVFAELDADRRTRLAGVVADFEQVIVTAAVEGDVPASLRVRTVRVEAGTIVTDADV